MKNKNNFWDNTQGVFPLTAEGEFTDLISLAVNTYKNSDEFEVNFNQSGDAFFIRTKDFAVRIASKWGLVGNCKWEIERDFNPSKSQMVIIHYNDLEDYFQSS